MAATNNYIQPINHDYDYALRIYKLPEIMILADGDSKNFDYSYGSNNNTTHVINPGNFVKNKTFYVLYPFKSQKEVV